MSDDDKIVNKHNSSNVSPPDVGDNFKMFLRVLDDNDGDDIMLDAALDSYSTELDILERRGLDILETIGNGAKKLFGKKKAVAPDYLNPAGTVPTTTDEAVEHQLKRKVNTAADVVFRPEVPSVEKKSTFFKDVNYDVSIDKFSAMKKLTPNLEAGTVVDYFDKAIGVQLKKSPDGSYTTLKGSIEYEPFDNTLQIKSSYHMPLNSIEAKVYLNKGNPGAAAEFSKQISKKTYIKANASWFKSDAAFEIDYKTKLKDDSYITIGAYGSTYYKETGMRFRWNFYGN